MPPPPTAGIDISSAPEPQEAIVTCDRRLCFLCGEDPARVIHLVARKPGGQLQYICQISSPKSKENDPSNPLCICPAHHEIFGFESIRIPGKRQIESIYEVTAEHYEEICTRTRPNTPPNLPAPSLSFWSDEADDGEIESAGADMVVQEYFDAKEREDLSVEAEAQMMQYAKEQSVTWEELRNRSPLYGGEAVGT